MRGGWPTKRSQEIGVTFVDVLTAILVLIVLAVFISFVVDRPRSQPLSKRGVCAANLMGLGTACHIYSTENENWFPVAPYATANPDSETNDHPVSFAGRIGSNLTQQLDRQNNTSASVTRSLFMLIIGGGSTAAQYTCPVSGDEADNMRNVENGREIAAQPGVNRFDFKSYNNISYGYQLPFGPRARPTLNLKPTMAYMADKGPYFAAGKTNKSLGTTPDQTTNVGPPGFAKADEAKAATNEQWRPFNSRNHKSEGQMVLFLDTHAEWLRKPIVGVDGDNIYTMQSGGTLLDILNGARPQDRKGPLTETDSLIVP